MTFAPTISECRKLQCQASLRLWRKLKFLLILSAFIVGLFFQPQLPAKPADTNSTPDTATNSFAWQQTDRYVAPNFNAFFPDDTEGAKRLTALWGQSNKDSIPADEMLDTVRAGLRRYNGNRAAVITWVGQHYIWNAHPQNPKAIEMLYHASDFSGPEQNSYGVRHEAVYFGLSVVYPKTPSILRALTDLCVAVDDPNDIQRVSWGAKADRAELLRLLKPYLDSPESVTREKAEDLARIFKGELEPFEWGKTYALKIAKIRFSGELPEIRKILETGASAQRKEILEKMLHQNIVAAMDDSFLDAFAPCVSDSDADVRALAIRVVGARWFERGKTPHPNAVDLLLRFGQEENPKTDGLLQIQFWDVAGKDRRIVRYLLEMAIKNRMPRRLVDDLNKGLSDDQEMAHLVTDDIVKEGDPGKIDAVKKIYRQIAGREYTGPVPTGPARTIKVGPSKQTGSIQAALDIAPAGSVISIEPGLYEERISITRPVTLEGAGPDKTVILSRTDAPPESYLRGIEERMRTARTQQEKQSIAREAQEKIKSYNDNQSTITISSARGVVLRHLKVTNPSAPPRGGTQQHGLVSCSQSEVLIDDCHLVGSPFDALRSRTTDLEMRHCLVAAVWGTGVSLDTYHGGGSARIVDCDIRNCHHVGIAIGYNTPATVERCRVSGSAWHGIRYAGSPKIVNNLIFGNYRSGIYSSGWIFTLIQGNVFYRNEFSAIAFFESNRERIEGNTFIENRREAIGVYGGSQPVLRGNVFQGNARAIYCAAINNESPDLTGAPVIDRNLFWKNEQDVVRSTGSVASGSATTESTTPLAVETLSFYEDPLFRDIANKDFTIQQESIVVKQGIGAANPLTFASPWPLQPEEKAIIPDTDSRDDRLWKRPKAN